MAGITFSIPRGTEQKIYNLLNELLVDITSTLSRNHPDAIVTKIPEDIFKSDNIVIIAIGKNAATYAQSLISRFRASGSTDQISYIFQAEGYSSISEFQDNNVHYSLLPHPLPSQETLKKTGQLLQFLKRKRGYSSIHFVITGGGSSCFALPEPEFTFDHYLNIINQALLSGFSISEINLVRSLIDRVKGGKFLFYTRDFPVYSWGISDVISNDMSVIGSGPTTPCLSFQEQIIEWFEMKIVELGIKTTSEDLISRLEEACELYQKHQDRYSHQVLLTRQEMLTGLKNQVENRDYNVINQNLSLNDTIELCVEEMYESISQYTDQPGTVLIWAGEPTISLPEEIIDQGEGGRISALCCLISEKIQVHENVVFLGLATDARDGTSPSSAYFVTSETADHLRPLGGARKVIFQGISGYALTLLNYGISISPTDLNVADIYLAVIR